MFGGLELPKKPALQNNASRTVDFFGTSNVRCGHTARQPGSDYKHRMMLYEQRKADMYVKNTESMKKELDNSMYKMKFDIHTEKRGLTREIKARVDGRLREYDLTIDIKRERLRELLLHEQQMYFRETVAQAQRGDESRMEDMKARLVALKAQREEERLQLVQEKRIQQMLAKYDVVRPILSKKLLLESKNTQLVQIKEKEMKREQERELENHWHEVAMMEYRKKIDHEKQVAKERFQSNKDTSNVRALQVKGHEELKKQRELQVQHEQEELKQLEARMRQEEIENLEESRRKRDALRKEILEQIRIHEEYLNKVNKEEKLLEDAFHQVALNELKAEQRNTQNTKTIQNKEMKMYIEHVKQLERQRKADERMLDELLKEARKAAEEKQDAAKCKLHAAKEKLKQDVLMERRQQVELKKHIAEQERKMKEAEDELLKLQVEQYEREKAEKERKQLEERMKYREDLRKQAEYNKILTEQEMEEEKHLLEMSKKEEQQFKDLVEVLETQEIKTGAVHPFKNIRQRAPSYYSNVPK